MLKGDGLKQIIWAVLGLLILSVSYAQGTSETNQEKIFGHSIDHVAVNSAPFQSYLVDWRKRVEDVGNLNYPEAARGKFHGSLELIISINADGSLASKPTLIRSSGYKILDDAALNIIQMAAPYPPLPSNVQLDTGHINFIQLYKFTTNDQVSLQYFGVACSNESIRGNWKQGVHLDKDVGNIIEEFNPEYQKIVSFLDGLPVKTDEDVIAKGLGKNPDNLVKIPINHTRAEWEFTGTDSTLDVIIQEENGCILYITVGEASKSDELLKFTRRTNKHEFQ